ncbi:RNA-binding protein [Syntrophus gentianae]|uniref:RNA-binding protein n=1 Tax=Syntrophus gentianae TaxID=43775 RepID=A0A1H7VEG3_9BACT|nr:ribosome assembly RNA-binding protein YhbY [Syntrophus gentianae]SEM07305.1 RNA-binding protein [Syntrophus gentianae]
MLTGKQKRFLRRMGHDLKPVVLIGKSEVSESVLQETDSALEHHELIKVKLLDSSLTDRREAAEQMASSLNAEIAQILGRTFLLYRKAEQPKIALP